MSVSASPVLAMLSLPVFVQVQGPEGYLAELALHTNMKKGSLEIDYFTIGYFLTPRTDNDAEKIAHADGGVKWKNPLFGNELVSWLFFVNFSTEEGLACACGQLKKWAEAYERNALLFALTWELNQVAPYIKRK